MKRRNFLKAMFAAPVAAPAALAAVTEGLVQAPVNYGAEIDPAYYGKVGIMKGGGADFSYLASIKNELARYLQDPPPINRYIKRVTRLDPDIAAARSLSLAAKIRAQAERDRAADMEETVTRMQRRIMEATPCAA